MNGAEKKEHGEFAERLRPRTKGFAFDVLKLCRDLPTTAEGRVIGNQLLRAGMSVGANYRAVTRARSTAEFISKVNVVIEETDEAHYWLESLAENGVFQGATIDRLLKEADELIRILSRSQSTAIVLGRPTHNSQLLIYNS